MKSLQTAALALAIGIPGAAQAADGQPGATSTGSFEVGMTVTAPQAPTLQVLGLHDASFGTITQADLTAAPTYPVEEAPFCVKLTNAANVIVVPLISFSQPSVTVFNSDLGQNFALVGPARAGTASGNAQIPFRISYESNGFSQTYVEWDRRFAGNESSVNVGDFCTGQNGSFYGTTAEGVGIGRSKPVYGIRRLNAADGNNPAGLYHATIQVTVLAQ